MLSVQKKGLVVVVGVGISSSKWMYTALPNLVRHIQHSVAKADGSTALPNCKNLTCQVTAEKAKVIE